MCAESLALQYMAPGYSPNGQYMYTKTWWPELQLHTLGPPYQSVETLPTFSTDPIILWSNSGPVLKLRKSPFSCVFIVLISTVTL